MIRADLSCANAIYSACRGRLKSGRTLLEATATPETEIRAGHLQLRADWIIRTGSSRTAFAHVAEVLRENHVIK